MSKFANAAYTEGSYVAASRGISPHDHAVAMDTYLYRFIDLGRGPASKGADGPWWFEYDHYRSIVSFAEKHGYSLGYAARLFAAILYEWSEANAVVRARVTRGPLFAWKGIGKQVSASSNPGQRDGRDVATQHGLLTERRSAGLEPTLSAKMTPTQGPSQVLQLFIPGLGAPHFKFSAFMSLKEWAQIRSHTPQPG
jgi:hypothetical protein